MINTEITRAIEKYELVPDMILLTHGHFDHIFSLDILRKKYNIPVLIHESDAEMLSDSVKNAYSFFFDDSFTQKEADRTFSDGDSITIGSDQLTVIHTPGHTKGSSCFMCDDLLITGDTLFAEGIGRTDLYGGNYETIIFTLKTMRYIENDDDITIYPGHGRTERLSRALDNVIYY